LFAQQKHKHDEMAFLTFRNASKHVLLALGVDGTARDSMKAKFTEPSLANYTLHSVTCET